MQYTLISTLLKPA